MEKLKDVHVREELMRKLKEEYSYEPDTRIVNEMAVCQGTSRVDIAVINGVIHGYEIKSESDTLNRLPSQMNDYNRVFDRVTIVTASDYLEKVRDIVPEWWGIICVKNKNGKPILRKIKKGRKNPSQDALALVQLLWRDEALSILKERGLHKGYLSKPRQKLFERLVETIPLKELKLEVNRLLKQREGWRDF
ncbi:sce7726 family protein [Aneurinibacillus thermoaerophilus]|uniref:sce7726 family protein n=1 Tax=Aneurinibacillus thermoaerophilus TaxID=143495 RepID=UPI002E21DBE4|nr:sce7726 family protein [Aneurinibacillus thermoaerophilus]MED0762705.1 sce7726 family protein [Aneurinibacillus thermoaerophilus]